MKSVKIATIGSVDAGKSTLVGVLKTGKWDNGNGLARSQVFVQKHERESGRTSSISVTSIEFSNLKYHLLILDLAGHEPYLKTTIKGLTSHFPDYAMLVIDSHKGVLKMAREHWKICTDLNIPLFIVITKIDSCPPRRRKDTMSEIRDLLRQWNKNHPGQRRYAFRVTNDKVKGIVEKFLSFPNQVFPVFQVSNVKGTGIDNLKKFITMMIPRKLPNYIDVFMKKHNFQKLFHIYKPYYKYGIGHIIYGQNMGKPIKKGDVLKIGPRVDPATKNKMGYLKVRVRSLHDKKSNEVNVLDHNEIGCLAIKPLNTKFKLTKSMLKDGRIAIDENDLEMVVFKFKASVLIHYHSTTINKGYTPHIHCSNVRDTVKLIDGEKLPMRTGNMGTLTFQFNKPQFVHPGARILFRDGIVRILGIVTQVFEVTMLEKPTKKE